MANSGKHYQFAISELRLAVLLLQQNWIILNVWRSRWPVSHVMLPNKILWYKRTCTTPVNSFESFYSCRKVLCRISHSHTQIFIKMVRILNKKEKKIHSEVLKCTNYMFKMDSNTFIRLTKIKKRNTSKNTGNQRLR